MDTNIQRYNKGLVAPKKSRQSMRNIKTLGISQVRHLDRGENRGERQRERYHETGQRMRQRYELSRHHGKGRKGRRRKRKR